MSEKYSKTVIYKIVCLDPTITDVYVGSTTDFNTRKRRHKSECFNENSKNYNNNKYQIIRANGGIDNWEMIKIEDFPCENLEQQLEQERYWIDVLKPSMNMVLPFQTEEELKNYFKEYNEKRKEERKIYDKEYQEKNKEKLKIIRKEYNKKNKEK